MSSNIEIPAELIDTLRSAKRCTALTGAGISAESGIPTFRQSQTGLWEKYDPMDLATPIAFRKNPRLVWEWYAWRRGLIAQAVPNAGHKSLVEIESRVSNFTLITQNVDGLHQRAGSSNVIELHGNINRSKCFAENIIVDTWEDDGSVPPRCPRCGDFIRPDVVWFGENLPEGALQQAWQAARNCEVFLSIGTSSIVQPAASLPTIALESGAVVLEINPHETPLTSNATYSLKGPAGFILPLILSMVWP